MGALRTTGPRVVDDLEKALWFLSDSQACLRAQSRGVVDSGHKGSPSGACKS